MDNTIFRRPTYEEHLSFLRVYAKKKYGDDWARQPYESVESDLDEALVIVIEFEHGCTIALVEFEDAGMVDKWVWGNGGDEWSPQAVYTLDVLPPVVPSTHIKKTYMECDCDLCRSYRAKRDTL